MTTTQITTAEAVRDNILRQYYALDIHSDLLTDIMLTAVNLLEMQLPHLDGEQIAELEAHFIERFQETDPEPHDEVILQAIAIERQLLSSTFSFWCEFPNSDRHWAGAKPVQRWGHNFNFTGKCKYIQLCEECAREGWPPPKKDYTVDDCVGPLGDHQWSFLTRTNPQ